MSGCGVAAESTEDRGSRTTVGLSEAGACRVVEDDLCSGHSTLRGQVWYTMDETDYFKSRVLDQRPYIQRAWCEEAVRTPDATEVQPDGRIRHWLYIPELGKYLRVITLADGKTLHNAFPDRSFKRG